jgi:hypothetical protein
VASGAGVPIVNHSLTALRFLFVVTLRKPAIVLDMPFEREPRPSAGGRPGPHWAARHR